MRDRPNTPFERRLDELVQAELGVEVAIEPRQVMVFKPSNVLKAKINGQAINGLDKHDEDA